MSLHGTPEPDRCYRCEQRVPMRLRDVLRDVRPVHVIVRWVPGYTWVRFDVLPFRWEKPNKRPLLRGIVRRYSVGPARMLTLPKKMRLIPPLDDD